MDSPTVIAGFITLALGLLLYAVLVPRATSQYAIGLDGATPSKGMKFVGVVSAEIYASLPAGLAQKIAGAPPKKIDSLIQRSGNPWNIKASDFRFLQLTLGVIGAALGLGVWFILSKTVLDLPLPAVIAFAAFLGFYMPMGKYKEAAKNRDIDFKRQLPDALDLIIISLSAGTTFSSALRESLPQMKDGVLREELLQVSRSIDSGKTMSQALDEFASKAPSESITAFVRAVQEATELNVPLIEVLESRAEASRKEFFALLQQRTATLESKMMAVLTPTLVPALLVIVLAPAGASLMKTMG